MAEHEMTVAQLRDWLRAWVAEATGEAPETLRDDAALESFGLSSRDAVTLTGDLEDLLGHPVDATIAYQHPSIGALAEHLIHAPHAAAAAADSGGPAQGTSPSDQHTGPQRRAMGHDIAIVGMAARFPGGADTPEAMWQLLAVGGDGTSERDPQRWSEWAGDAHVQQVLGEITTRAGWLPEETVKGFDAEFFGMSPREAEMVDPQQRLALELTWEALEDAHIPASQLKGAQVGVFMGASSADFQSFITADSQAATPYAVTGSNNSIISGRVSYVFDFRGPSMTLDTACSSALVAVHEAVQALRGGTADVAVAGGVNMMVAPAATMGFAKTGAALSPDGRIKAFSADADGICRAEGGGVLVLKRLTDAVAAGDAIQAVIKGSAVNQDGRSNGLTAPNPEAQQAVLVQAYADAGVDPQAVDYVEAHGTGTILGDPIEAGALGAVLGAGRETAAPVLLGSAKTNFGHLESAAGAAGLIKVVLGMQHNQLPPSINYSAPNPYIDFAAARLRVVERTTPWPRYSGHAVAGVSGFGFGGTNAHVVVQEYRATDTRVTDTDAAADAAPDAQPRSIAAALATDERARFDDHDTPPTMFVLSASLPSRRRMAALALAQWLDEHNDASLDLPAVARTLARRNHGRCRAVVLARTTSELINGLRAVAKGIEAPGTFCADTPDASGPVWVFSGFGAQHRKMAKELYLANPLFRTHLERVDELIDFEAGYSMIEMFLDDSQTYGVETAQVGIFAIQVALVDTFGDLGCAPEAVIGHSMGEVAAAYAAGGLPLEEAVRVICVRSRLMGEAESAVSDADAGAMALVEYSAAEVDQIIAEHPEFASIEPAVYAAPTHTTVGGRAQPVADFVAWVEAQGKFARQLQVRGAGHTSDTDMLLGDLAAELAGLEARPLRAGLYSSVDKETFYPAGHEPVHGTEYWVKGMRHAVWFTQAVRRAVEDGHTTFAEFNANPVAGMSVLATVIDAGLDEPALVHTLKRKESEVESFLGALATFYVHGHAVNVGQVVDLIHGPAATAPAREGERPAMRGYAPLPLTAFHRKRLWPQVVAGGGASEGRLPGAHVALPDGRHAWQAHAHVAPSLDAVVTAAAATVLPGARLGAIVRRGVLPAQGIVTTTLTPHPGGASLQVHAHAMDGFELLAEAVVVAPGAPGHTTAAPDTDPATAPAADASAPAADASALAADLDPDAEASAAGIWSADSGEPLGDRLAHIIANSMGYDPADLPREVPLLDLGLDSLMAVRIKNRVEHAFAIPPLQLQAMRDASFNDVVRMVRYAVENPADVADLAAQQADGAAPVDTATLPTATDNTTLPTATDAATSAEVAPRDDTERMVFGVWAVVTGAAAPGVLGGLPPLSDADAAALAVRLSQRCGGEISAVDVTKHTTIADLADVLRPYTEATVDGGVRVLRAAGAAHRAGDPTVFLFHAAGGTSLVYEPLVEHLPDGIPVYGVERREGTLAERARAYVELLRERAGDGPYVLGGWSFGGALALEVGRQLREHGAQVALLVLLDTVQPSEDIPATIDEQVARWQRYAEFARTTYGLEFEVPVDYLREHGEDGLFELMLDSLGGEASQLGGGVIEHQRASFVDNRILESLNKSDYANIGAHVPVVLYRAERMHDGAIALEPRYAHIDPDGGWGPYVDDLEIVHCPGDHLAIVDEPAVGKVGRHLSGRLAALSPSRPHDTHELHEPKE